MNILVVHQYLLTQNGTGGSRFNEITRKWEEDGNHVTVLAGMVYHNTGKKYPQYKGKFLYEEYYTPNLRVLRCHDSEGAQNNFLMRLWGYLAFVFSSCIAGVFKARDKYDCIVVTSPPLTVGITALVLSKWKRIPLVFEVRDLWPESAVDTGVLTNKTIIKFAYWIEALIYKNASLINVLTPAFRTRLIEKGVAVEKIIFIPNAADFSISDKILADFDSQAFKKKIGLEGKTVITYVGAHGVANHLIQVLETAKELKEEGNEEVVFMLIGDGMRKKALLVKAAEEQLDNVKFVDSVTKQEVFKYIAASDFGMSVLKKVDTFKTVYSNKTFDYMACKRPIFMLIDGVSRDLVEDAQCGLYVEPENPSAFAAAIKKYLAMPRAEWYEQGERGYEYAKTYFDRDKLSDKYLNHLKTLESS